MHQSSYDKMSQFCKSYLSAREKESLTILDIGSQDVNGCYRPLFENDNWRYIGIDMAPGKNVNIVVENPYRWKEIASESVDVVISGQAFEHIEYFWITMLEIARILKPSGIGCILAPSSGPEHRYPLDCWRFYPDGFRAMAKFADLEVLECATQWEDAGYPDSNAWHDSMLVFRKPHSSGIRKIKNDLRRLLRHKALTGMF